MQRFLLLLAALVAVPAVSAQTTIGVRAGLNTSFWTGPDADGTDASLGFTGGLAARLQATPSFGIQAEALYSQKGVRDETILDEIGTYNLDYLEIPVLARFSVPVSPFADAGAFVGPSVAIPLSSTYEFDDEVGGGSLDLDAKTQFGVTAGVDYYSGPVGVDLRYTAGLNDVFDEADFIDVQNQVFSVTLGYRFGG